MSPATRRIKYGLEESGAAQAARTAGSGKGSKVGAGVHVRNADGRERDPEEEN